MSGKVGESLLRGNYGEHLVTLLLSRMCLVRPVVGQTDVGVDLYCESVIDSRPFLHFWGQVKSSEEFANEAVEVSCPFKVSALEYWSRQPVPVLGFLVPLKWPPEEIRYIHVIDITFDILEHGIRHDQEWQTLKSKPALILPVADREQLSVKLRSPMVDHLPMAVSAMYAEKGFILPAPKPQEERTKSFACHFLTRYIPQIELRIKHAAVFAIRQWLDAGNDLASGPMLLLSVLENLEGESRHEIEETLGVVCQARTDAAGAKAHYEKAILCIQNDAEIDSTKPPWSENIARLNARNQSLGSVGNVGSGGKINSPATERG
ncbi:MAG: DUF4365 domain-containing protein [Gemmataceae bacterium]